eukprot:2509358-Prymnesium_polylepis.2
MDASMSSSTRATLRRKRSKLPTVAGGGGGDRLERAATTRSPWKRTAMRSPYCALRSEEGFLTMLITLSIAVAASVNCWATVGSGLRAASSSRS